MVSNAAPVGCLFVCVFLMMLLLMNPRTYTQSHTPTVVQFEGVRGGGVIEPSLSFWYVAIFRNDLGLGQVDTTIYHVMKGYAISATVTELKMKLTFYYIVQVFVR